MSPTNQINYLHTEEQIYQMKLKRRDAYIKIKADKKNRRYQQRGAPENYEKGKSRVLRPTEETKRYCAPILSRQTGLTIKEPSSINIKKKDAMKLVLLTKENKSSHLSMYLKKGTTKCHS